MTTRYGTEISDEMVENKMINLVNQFYKILPIKESGEPSLTHYMKSLQREMIGCKTLIVALENDARYLTLLSILQYMIDNDCDTATVKTEVFKAINLLHKLRRNIARQKGGERT